MSVSYTHLDVYKRQGQPLGLPAGKAGAAAANDRVGAVFHGKHFVLQGYGLSLIHI